MPMSATSATNESEASERARNPRPGDAASSSRESIDGAGWTCSAGTFASLLTKRDRPFSWLSPAPIWQSRNDRLAR